MSSSASYRTRSKASSSTKSARAKAEATKAHLALVDSEADLEEQLEMLRISALQKEVELKTKLKKIKARKEVALTATCSSRDEDSVVSYHRHRASSILDPTPLDTLQRTTDYVISQRSLKQSEAPVTPPADQPFRPPPFNHTLDPPQDLLLYMARREMLSSSLTRFSDQPKDYRAWKSSFLNTISGLRLSPREEMDMLVKWLGRHSSDQANRLRTAYFNRPEKGLYEIWRRLDKCYGAVEVIEDSIFQRLEAFPKITRDFTKLRDLSDLLAEVQALKDDGDIPGLAALDTARGIRQIVEKLPSSIGDKWAAYGAKYKRQHQVSFPPFSIFAGFVEQQADDRNDPSFYRTMDIQTPRGPERTSRGEVSVHRIEVNPKNCERLCPIHKTPHPLRKCWAFRKKPLSERKDILIQNGMCLRCCSTTDHIAKNCKALIKCAECGSDRHDTSMHQHPIPQPTDAKPMPLHGGEREDVSANCLQICGDNVNGRSCSKICLVNVYSSEQEKSLKTYAVIDEHSNKSLARSEFFNFFNDQGPTSTYTLRTCAGITEASGRRALGYKVGSLDGKTTYTLPTLIECNEIPDNRSEIPTPDVIRKLPHLAVIADEIPVLDPDAPILLLLGRDVIEAHKVRKTINGPRGAPHAQKLDLGWIVVGDICPGRIKNKGVSVFFTNTLAKSCPSSFEPCPNLIHVRERYGPLIKTYRTEHQELGQSVFQLTREDESTAHSIEDRMFLKIMKQNLERDHNNSWVAPLPFKPSRRRLPNNRSQAAKRLLSLLRQFKKNPQLEKDFLLFMGKLLEKKHAVVAPPLATDEERWYLPMFGIYHPKKPGKIRVVFDSSAQYNGVSLNDTLLTGPDLINTLVGVLIRFRKDLVAIMADIEQMFYCFQVKPEHRKFLRFLWFRDNDSSKEVTEYQMNVHVFGNRPSPAVATYCLRQSVYQRHPDCNRDVEEFVERNFYVDDGLMSVPTTEEAISLLRKTRSVLAGSNLRLHKIASNKSAVTSAFPSEDRANDNKDLDLDENIAPVQRSLGLNWDSKGDFFFFRVADLDKPYTRRGVLSTINSLYDPLGFVAPVTVQGKFILRTLTTDNSDWDAPLPPQKYQLWTAWKDSLKDLHNLKIPRAYATVSPSTALSREICIFSDASTQAIAAVAYLRLSFGNGSCETAFLMGKTKLTPQAETSIPRLELCAAVLAVELADLVCQELDMVANTTFYTDSKVVLGYINNEVRRFYVYVANRVQRIRRTSQPKQWHYIATDQNPADCGTRSVPATQLHNTPWLHGPAFLSQPPSHPADRGNYCLIDPEQDIEIRPVVSAYITRSDSLLHTNRFERFSSWTVVKRTVARLIHIARTFRKENRSSKTCSGWHYCKTLTVEVLMQAENVIIKAVQRHNYAKEISCLEEARRLPSNSTIKSLDPFLDERGLLRVGGRTRRAGLSQEEMHPIIIPGKHHLATLLVRHHHQLIHHQGRHFTEGAVRAAGLWIVGAKRCINKVIRACVKCKRLRGPVEVQKLSDLPEDRVAFSPPFTNVGLDVFGPWTITSRRTRGGLAHCKRWATIFTCMTTRAIHIEVIESLDTSSLINALRRFFAIRGPVRLLRSDQGTNFIGARKELGIASNLDCDAIRNHLSDSGCTWLFNPPHAPHMGGAWERMVGVAKRILNAMLLQHGSTRLSHEVLTTFLAEVTAIVNARPLVPVSTDPEDPVLLTPATLLTQKIGSLSAPPGKFDSNDVSRRQWRHVQHLAQTFWNRWKNQYLPLLQPRKKWVDDIPNLSPGSVVLMKNKERKRNEWPLGLVTRVFPSKDGKIRQVELRTRNKDCARPLVRPISELILLIPALESAT